MQPIGNGWPGRYRDSAHDKFKSGSKIGTSGSAWCFSGFTGLLFLCQVTNIQLFQTGQAEANEQ
jgi:hypothetical protein